MERLVVTIQQDTPGERDGTRACAVRAFLGSGRTHGTQYKFWQLPVVRAAATASLARRWQQRVLHWRRHQRLLLLPNLPLDPR
jgi:hypothetical protein